MKNYKNVCADCACLVVKDGAWCCDECFCQKCEDLDECPEGIECEEVTTAQNVSSKVKHGAGDTGKKSTPRKKEVSADKSKLFALVVEMLENNGYSFEIAKENKLIEVNLGNGIAIDLKEHRKK